MDTSPENNYPHLCFQVELTCEACVSETAGQLAQACKGLRGKAVGQLFVQIHPHSACARMHAQFAAAYRHASREDRLETRPAAMAAVA
jgi:hypothetical protein